jgi:RHS repeat-associated protein
MTMPGRNYEAPNNSYRYGFNGKEKDNSTTEGSYDFGARIYDSRLGRWLSVDPLQKKYPNESNYVWVSNSPIFFKDADGRDKVITTTLIYELGNGKTFTITHTQVKTSLEDYLQEAVLSSDGKASILRYNYYDVFETHTRYYNAKGESTGSSDLYDQKFTSNPQIVSKNDFSNFWGRMGYLASKNSRKEKHRNGGGIVFTSSSGQGGGPTASNPDGQSENIDLFVMAADMARKLKALSIPDFSDPEKWEDVIRKALKAAYPEVKKENSKKTTTKENKQEPKKNDGEGIKPGRVYFDKNHPEYGDRTKNKDGTSSCCATGGAKDTVPLRKN